MNHLKNLLNAHPAAPSHLETLRTCLMACLENIGTCNGCADACLHENPVKMMDCIRVCLDCATVCTAGATLLARVDAHQPELWRAQLQACEKACVVCAKECRNHDNAHCKACAEACDACASACRELIQALSKSAA